MQIYIYIYIYTYLYIQMYTTTTNKCTYKMILKLQAFSTRLGEELLNRRAHRGVVGEAVVAEDVDAHGGAVPWGRSWVLP